MESRPFLSRVTVPAGEVEVAPTSLYAALAGVRDRHKRRGVRSRLAVGLTVMIVAKLAGEQTMSGIAPWARRRSDWRCEQVKLARKTWPGATTDTLISANVELEELNAVVVVHVAPTPPHACEPVSPAGAAPHGGSRHLALDGKRWRGTRPAGASPPPALPLVGLDGVSHQMMLAPAPLATTQDERRVAVEWITGRDRHGARITADALPTQRPWARQV